MTARRTWWSRTRRPRPTDPDPYTRLDHRGGLPGRTRYDAEWPDVLAAEAPGGDLAAMAAPLDPYLGLDWCGSAAWGSTAPGDWGEYDIGPWYAYRYIPGASSPEFTGWGDLPDLPMVRAAATAYDLGLPVPLRSDPPIYRACLAGHAGVGVGA